MILAVIVAVPVIPTFWAIVDLPRRRFSSTKYKVIWFAVVSTLPCLGAALYFYLPAAYAGALILTETAETPGPLRGR